jgi:hypothetical protein
LLLNLLLQSAELGMPRIELDRARYLPSRAGDIAGFQFGLGKQEMRLRIVRRMLDCVLKEADRERPAILPERKDAEIIVSAAVRRVEAQRGQVK